MVRPSEEVRAVEQGAELPAMYSPPPPEQELDPAAEAAADFAVAVAGAIKPEPAKFKPKPPMVPDEATVKGAHVPVAPDAPAGIDIGVKIGADEVPLAKHHPSPKAAMPVAVLLARAPELHAATARCRSCEITCVSCLSGALRS